MYKRTLTLIALGLVGLLGGPVHAADKPAGENKPAKMAPVSRVVSIPSTSAASVGGTPVAKVAPTALEKLLGAPSTVAPVKTAPTTSAPTTSAPTTSAPTTSVPTTSVSSTSVSRKKPSAALRLATYWGKRHGLSSSEIEEQATAIEEAVSRTRGPAHEGHDIPDRYAFKFRTLEIPKGSKRSAIILRSNQPAPENLVELAVAVKKVGIDPKAVAIINLRAENNVEASYVRDFADASNAEEQLAGRFRTMNLRILDHTIPRVEQVLEVLKVLSDPNIKVAVLHCKAGRARTGIMVAIQRIVLDGWSVEASLEEAKDRGLRRPLQVAFVRQFASDWKSGKIKLNSSKTTEKG